MKSFILIIFFSLYLQKANAMQAMIPFNNDTINVTDSKNSKQGYWVIKNTDKKAVGYREDQVIEEGFYKDGRKTGVWKSYHPNGKLKSEITFVNNRPFGFARFYFPNGSIQEEGIWENNRWMGAYKTYYENGKTFYDWKFNETGKREGQQKYFYNNGQLMIEGIWKEGRENGLLKEYYDDGSLKSEKNFSDGVLDVTSVKNYEFVVHKPEEQQKLQDKSKEENITIENVTAKENIDIISDGFHKVYNKKHLVEKEGEFKNGMLWEGKIYEYRGENIVKTTIFKNGKETEVKLIPSK